MLLAALLLIWPLTETHTAPEASCLLVRQGPRVYLAMEVEVSRITGSATVTLPGPEVTIGTPPPITDEQKAKLAACYAERDATLASNAAKAEAHRSWRECRSSPADCRLGDKDYLQCMNAGPRCGPEPEEVGRYDGMFSGIVCEALAGVSATRTKRSPGRTITLARYDSISSDVPCICKWDHCVAR